MCTSNERSARAWYSGGEGAHICHGGDFKMQVDAKPIFRVRLADWQWLVGQVQCCHELEFEVVERLDRVESLLEFD